MTAQEKLNVVRQAHGHINAAYRLLLTMTPSQQEDQLTRLIERLENFLEAQTPASWEKGGHSNDQDLVRSSAQGACGRR